MLLLLNIIGRAVYYGSSMVATIIIREIYHLFIDIEVELVGGTSEDEGRVQINLGGRQGTICDDYWDWRDAKIVCNMLNYER